VGRNYFEIHGQGGGGWWAGMLRNVLIFVLLVIS